MLGVIGLLLAITILIIGAYKGLEAIPLTLLSAFVVIITSGLPIWDTYASVYATGFSGTFQSYFFIFVASAVYAVIMESTGCTISIGYKLMDWFGRDKVVLVIAIFVALLTYGGVSSFVIIFATVPIIYLLLKEADLPRRLVPGLLFMGSACATMTTFPGTPQLPNVIPTQYLGTTMTAAPVLSIIAGIVFFLANYIFMKHYANQVKLRGEHWSFPEGYDVSLYEEQDRSALPSAGGAFAPIVVLLSIILGCSLAKLSIASNASMLTTIAMLAGSVVCYVLNKKHLKTSLKDLVGKAATKGVSAMVALAAIVGFGTVVSSSAAFQDIVNWLIGVNMSPYWKGVFATSVISGITASSSAGVRLVLQNMADYFIASGCDLSILHRLMAIASGSLDSLPHTTGMFLIVSYLGLKHKESYYPVFIVSVVTPLILVILLTATVTLLGI